ncbi:enoyl-CoA hydratase-related protein [Limibaculum sp. FT325]|uniref:enoyl-CoA hydratase-related protein n=1 Tax=Thermohalobaculum sediminis TaxID=2939436 RepID=UPI0020BE5744|nr:enoyl-CoA hydratase-related protein [Limibaculum sediminis]MCL5777233.1 enoyl-CoA hydratase-related protein [Limibaculum sediminis]
MTGPVRRARRGRVLEITLDRPKANAIDAATSRAMGEAFRELAEDDGLSVAIVTGGGERFFSAGWDLKAAAAGEGPDADQGIGGFAGLTEYWGLKKPVIAAVNGMALGGGFELALAADLIVAAEHAEFGLPEPGLGIVADSGGMIRLPRRMPRAIAMEMMFTCRRVGAAELSRWGLINEVVPGERLMDAARALADRVAASAPLSLMATKEVVAATEGLGVEEAYRVMRGGLPIYSRVYASEDAAEGMAAFAERRAPVWKGR